MSKHWGTDRPMASKGLISYRYPSPFSNWIMIGAKDNQDALREANRSLTLARSQPATIDNLEVWSSDHDCYMPAK